MADETTATQTSETTETTDASATETANVTETTGAAAEGDGGNDTATASALGSATADDGTGDAGEGDGAGDKDGEGNATQIAVPEAYDLKLTVKAEDGSDNDVALDSALIEAATPVFKDVGLTNEQANKLLPLVPEIQQRLLAQQSDEFAATKADWLKSAQEDAEIGGKNWKGTLSLAAKALDHFGAPSARNEAGEETNEFRKLLNDTGLGEHPVMIRVFRNVGAALSEDQTLARTEGGAPIKKSREENLYPDDVPNK